MVEKVVLNHPKVAKYGSKSGFGEKKVGGVIEKEERTRESGSRWLNERKQSKI